MTEKGKPNNTDALKTKATGNNTDTMAKKATSKGTSGEDKTGQKAVTVAASDLSTEAKAKTWGKELLKTAIGKASPARSDNKTVVSAPVAEQPAPEGGISFSPWDEPLSPAVAPRRTVLEPSKKVSMNGVFLEPVAVDLKSQHGYLNINGVTVYLPYPNHRYEELTFSAYYLGGENGNTSRTLLLLDEYSSVTMEQGKVPYSFGRAHNRKAASVVMVNSSSKNDAYYGENYLINVDSEENTLNESRLEAKGSVQGYSWEYGAYAESDHEEYGNRNDKFVTGQSLRHRYEKSQFKKTTCIDSKLAEGFYSSCNLFRSTVKAANRCSLYRTEVKKTEIQGSDVTLRNSNFKACTLSCEGHVYVNSQRMIRESFHTASLHLLNKYCTMEVTLPRYNDLKMIRISEGEFELVNSSSRGNVKIGIKSGPYQIREHVEKFLNMTGPSEAVEGPNAFQESMVDYVVDSIVSRLGMVSMLDSAYHATRALTQESEPYDNPYGE